MIKFEDVWLFQDERAILRGATFEIKCHERVAILGPSGAGKTTILRLILGLQQIDSGRILIENSDIFRLKERQREKIRLKFSIVFQEGALFDSLSVKDNVAFYYYEYFAGSCLQEIEDHVFNLLRIVDMEKFADLMPEQLSGGMKRRVAVARALAVSEAGMNLYDEPTSGLDPVNAGIIRDLIEKVASEGKGFIIVTHEIIDALLIASRFMFLFDGVIVFDGDKNALIGSSNLQVRQFLKPYEKILKYI
jgi:phospholipid/cholesterol/gamma-HCH transport system ATP-binding protein